MQRTRFRCELCFRAKKRLKANRGLCAFLFINTFYQKTETFSTRTQFKTVFFVSHNYRLYNVDMKEEKDKGLGKLPKVLSELREMYGYTQRHVAGVLGITYQSYQAYELGISYPSLKNFVALADMFDVSLDYLIGRKEL